MPASAGTRSTSAVERARSAIAPIDASLSSLPSDIVAFRSGLTGLWRSSPFSGSYGAPAPVRERRLTAFGQRWTSRFAVALTRRLPPGDESRRTIEAALLNREDMGADSAHRASTDI